VAWPSSSLRERRRDNMSKLELTREEEKQLLEILERYYPSLRIEVVNTDDREFRRSLKQREAFMKDLIGRLKASMTT
jgi:hypothetical protein